MERLSKQADPVSAFVWKKLSIPEQALLTNYQPSAAGTNQIQDVVLHALNKIIGEPSFYEPERFKGVSLAVATTSLLQQSPSPKGDMLVYFNRLLLQDAYPLELSRSQRKDCVNCHNPHSPPFPSRLPAPVPHPLREPGATPGPQTGQE